MFEKKKIMCILYQNKEHVMARINRYFSLSYRLEQYLNLFPQGSILPSEQAISDRFQVSKQTLRRALKELEKMGLIQTKNGIGNMVIGHSESFFKELIFLCGNIVFFSEALTNFCKESAERGYIASIVPLHGDAGMCNKIFQTVLQRNPAGIILYKDPKQKIDIPVPENMPILHIIRRQEGIPGDLLTVQRVSAIKNIVSRFYAEGCRKFALYGFRGINPFAVEERRNGFLDGMKKLRLKVHKERILLPGSTQEQTDAFFQLFADEKKSPDAVCCMNDHCAGHFFAEMNQRGLPVDRLHVSGFDAHFFSYFFPKTILSVKVPMAELGKRAVELLIRRIENRGLSPVNETLKSELIYMKRETPAAQNGKLETSPDRIS